MLSERVATARILLLVNYRPEYQHPWGSKTYYTQLRLDPLGQAEAQELVSAFLGQETLPLPAREREGVRVLKHLILQKTEGNPLFMEEIVHALVEQGILIRDPDGGAGFKPAPTMNLSEMRLPPTVQGVLAARIDRLPVEEKALLQTLAVIGKEFPWSLLKQVVDRPDDELHRLLSHLQAREFLYEQPAFPEPEYTFKHALTQEVAYHSLLKERRRMLHERTAQAIEALYADRLEEHYSELAHHYSQSGNTKKAVEYLQRAGQQAVQRSAHAEAISHLTKALELLKTLPDTPERAQQELVLQTTFGPALMATKGFAAPEVEHAYARARELCQQMGGRGEVTSPLLFRVLQGLRAFYVLRGELQTARELGEQLFSLAQSVQDPTLLLEAHRALGPNLYFLGELAPARAHLEQGIALYDQKQHRSHAFLYGTDPGEVCLSYAALALWMLGYPEQALKRSHEALTLAQELSHPFSLAFALTHAAVLHQLRREEQAAQEQAEATMTLSTEQGFPFWMAWGTLYQGWALAQQGQGEDGILQMRQGLAAWRATGAELWRPYFLALLAEALAAVEKTGERFWEAELYRLKGELLLRMGETGKRRSGEVENVAHSPIPPFSVSSPEACFRQAIEIARRQQAKSLELRAVMSLSRLWQKQGKRDEARQMLSETYGWFTEGFDTADLKEAKAILDELS